MSDLKKGDRVTVHLPPLISFHGIITGEGRTGEWWNIIKDGTKYPRSISKSYCQPQYVPPVVKVFNSHDSLVKALEEINADIKPELCASELELIVWWGRQVDRLQTIARAALTLHDGKQP